MKKQFYLCAFLLLFVAAKSTAQLPAWLPPASLAAWYPLGNDADDHSGNGNHGIGYNVTPTANQMGTPNAAYLFNGVNSYIRINAAPSLNINGSVSVAAWVSITLATAQNTYQQIFWRGDAQGAMDPYSLLVANGRYGFRRDGNTTIDTVAASLIDNDFHHVVAIYDSAASLLKFYVDAVLVRTKSISSPITYATSSFWNMIGAVDNGTWQHFNGIIGEVAVYARPLTLCDIRQLYLHTKLNNSAPTTQNVRLCSGTPYNFGGLTLTTAGTYTHTYQNSQGCDSTVTLNLSYLPTYRMQQAVTLCQGTTYSFGGNTLSAAGTYTHTFTSSSGCDSIVTLHLAYVSGFDTTQQVRICPGSSYSFGGTKLTAAGTYKQHFSSTGGCDSNVTLILSFWNIAKDTTRLAFCYDSSIRFGDTLISAPGVYSAKFTSSQGCDSTAVLVYTKIYPPLVGFTSDPAGTALNAPITFNNGSQQAVRYLWSFGDGTTSNEPNPVHQYLRSGSYTVCLSAWSAEGCNAVACREVAAEVKLSIELPTAFSPNGDGQNDVLYVRGSGIKSFSLAVYNRWGQKVFETIDLQKGWDGAYNGTPLGSDVVAYMLSAVFIDGTKTTRQGNITLLP